MTTAVTAAPRPMFRTAAASFVLAAGPLPLGKCIALAAAPYVHRPGLMPWSIRACHTFLGRILHSASFIPKPFSAFRSQIEQALRAVVN